MNCGERAEALFLEGYNCAQAVFGALAPLVGVEEKTALRLASSFGGGMGRMREVCGACSGLFMAAGLLCGYDTPETGEIKAQHYALIRRLAEAFREKNGSIICRDLLGEGAEIGGTPSQRNEAFYRERPCQACIRTAADLFERLLEEQAAGEKNEASSD